MAKRISVETKAQKYSEKAIPVDRRTNIEVVKDICWCNKCCSKRAYVAGFKAARRSQIDRGGVE